MVFEGLGAYLVDKVEPGAGEEAAATVTLTGALAGDQILLKGVYFEFAAGANDLIHAGTVGDPILVGLGADDDAAAANLTLALNDAGVQVITDVPAPATIHPVGVNVGAPSSVVLITAESFAIAWAGPTSELTITTSNQTRVALDAAALAASSTVRTHALWDVTTLGLATAAIQNLVDSGLAATLVAVDVALAVVEADLTGATVSLSQSVGTLAELLSVLAGRTYAVPVGSVKFAGTTWSPTLRGSFTEANTVFDTGMLAGEWGATTAGTKALKTGGAYSKSTFIGGDTVNNEIGAARATFHSTAFAASVLNGQLANLAAGITLFPDADVQAHLAPTMVSKQTRQATLLNQRAVTVYDDDGTLLV